MSDEGKGLSKWQLALGVGVGATAVVGASLLAYVLYRRNSAGGTSKLPRGAAGGISGGAEETEGKDGEGEVEAKGNTDEPPLARALAIKQQGNTHFSKQQYEDAIRCYQEGITLCPEEKKEEIAKFHQNIAAVYDRMAVLEQDEAMKSGHLESVVAHCSLALKGNPRYIKALARRLRAFKTLDRKKEALLDVTRVLILDSTQNAALAEIVAGLLKDIGQEQAKIQFPKLGALAPTKQFVKTFLDSFIWRDDLSEERLKELWFKHRKSTPLDPEPEATLHEDSSLPAEPLEQSHDNPYEGFSEDPFVEAATMFRAQEYHGIIEKLTEAVETGCVAFLPHALLLRGTMFILWRQSEKALKDLTDVTNSKDISTEMVINALIKKASVFAGNSELEKLKSCFDKCLVLDSTSPDCLMHRARVNLELATSLDSLGAIVDDLEQTLSKVPGSAYAAFTLAAVLHRMAGACQSMELLDKAREGFEGAVKKFPTFVDGMVLYAMFLQDMGQARVAEELLDKAVKMEPDNSTVHLTMGILNMVSRRDLDKAAACMEKAIAVDNSCTQAYDTLASIEMQRANIDHALELYDQAVQFSRTEMEVGQALVAREVLTAQAAVCKEYGISDDLTSRLLDSNAALST